MKWQIKALSQKVISLMPWSYKLNYYAQHFLTVGKFLPHEFVLEKFKITQFHLQNLEFHSNRKKLNFTVLEIGSGWYPFVPLCLYMNGITNIILYDQKNLFTKSSLRKTILALEYYYENGHLQEVFPNLDKERYSQVLNLKNSKIIEEELRKLGICGQYGPLNKMKNVLPKIDFVVSNNTIQFFDYSELEILVSRLSEILNEDAILSFSIDLSDEFSHADNSLSKFNFLKYSKRKWYFISNKLNRPKRTIYSQYKNIFETKFEIIKETITRQKLEELENIVLHQEFCNYEKDELLISLYELALKLKTPQPF
jgi:hypothetical protein